MAVHKTFSRNWIFRSGFAISGKTPQKGLITSKNLTETKTTVTCAPDGHDHDVPRNQHITQKPNKIFRSSH